jgi:DNA-binding transcriptional ArsR family regulator
MDSRTRLLYWMLSASKGGPTRIRILSVLSGKPMNLRKLALELALDYKTVQGHIEMLSENGIIYTPKQGYGQVLFISPDWEENDFLKEVLSKNRKGKDNGDGNEKGKGGKKGNKK